MRGRDSGRRVLPDVLQYVIFWTEQHRRAWSRAVQHVMDVELNGFGPAIPGSNPGAPAFPPANRHILVTD
jgi:hypothetical protein